ncbi:MAG TPA: hypothetical protein VI874_05420 [Candidatus Norongarragalinales archaeon]|nr:hypothetical protein [Candidatus Norongarragalinales archaeon]
MIIYFLVLFGLLIAAYWAYPRWKASKRSERLEEEMPLFLRLCQVNSAHLPFERAIEYAASDLPNVSRFFSPVLAGLRSGKAVSSSLAFLSAQNPSPQVQRTCLQLGFSYTQGRFESLTLLASEFHNLQKQRLRAFASKTSFLSAWFVVLSCLCPALFFSYALVGSSLLSFTLTATDVLAVLGIFFPAVCALLVAWALSETPGGFGT